jgi:hypothetical protein
LIISKKLIFQGRVCAKKRKCCKKLPKKQNRRLGEKITQEKPQKAKIKKQ